MAKRLIESEMNDSAYLIFIDSHNILPAINCIESRSDKRISHIAGIRRVFCRTYSLMNLRICRMTLVDLGTSIEQMAAGRSNHNGQFRHLPPDVDFFIRQRFSASAQRSREQVH